MNIDSETTGIDAWLERANTELIGSSAQHLDVDAMIDLAKRTAVTDIGVTRAQPHRVWRDAARTATGNIGGTLAFKPPFFSPPHREAKVLPFPVRGDEPPAAPHASPQLGFDESRYGASNVQTALTGAMAGEPEAVRQLLEAIKPLVVRYCRARIGRAEGSFVSADDVAQEALLAVLTALPTYREGPRPFLAFVYRIAHHKVADVYRAAAYRREVATEKLPEKAADAFGRSLPSAAEGSTVDFSARMSRLLELLPSVQRDIIILRVVVGLSAEETAAVVGGTPGSVRVAQHRALTRLRKALRDQSVI